MARQPCWIAFSAERCLPASVFGPRDRAPFFLEAIARRVNLIGIISEFYRFELRCDPIKLFYFEDIHTGWGCGG